jgi:hypothetical protein
MTLSGLLWNLFFAFLSAFAGVVLGVLWAKRQWGKDRARQLQRLRANLIRAFRLNLERIDQCLEYLQRSDPVLPNFRLDAISVLHVLHGGRELFEDDAFFDRCDWQRYQLDHLNAKLDQLQTFLASSSTTQPRLTPSPFESPLQHLKVTRRDITQLLSDYESTA